MSIRVYIHYETDEAPHKTSKLTVPRKWVAEKTVVDVIGLFCDAYNKANPDHALEANSVHVVNNSGEKLYSDDVIGSVMMDHYDYFIHKGVHVKASIRQDPINQPEDTRLKCRNYGCNQRYREEENTDIACRHHVAPPIFHDRVKGWSCCREKKAYDWEEFQAIQGCTLGRHSTVDPQLLFASSPTVDAANAAEAKNPGPVLKSIAEYNQQNPDAATAASSAAKTLSAPRKSTRRDDGTAKCQNKGCQQDFIVSDNGPAACKYHAGQPIFHDAIKFWSCCPDKKCYDFESFLVVPGCTTGHHDDGVIELTSS